MPDDPSHAPLVRQTLQDYRTGMLSRREFLTRATALGLGAQAAATLGGLPAPAIAQPAIRQGGTLRIQQIVKPLRDPRAYDWSEMANQTRGFLEYLVEYQQDGSLRGMLAQDWRIDGTATRYTLHLRRGVQWNNGDPFTAADVAHNFARWCDTDYPGNSMASRMGGLIDPDTGQLRPEALRIVDDHTLELQLDTPDLTLITNLSDYPAAIVHPGHDSEDPFAHGVGTGPYRPVEMIAGDRCVLERNTDHDWWGSAAWGGPYLDRVEFLDYGTDPNNWAEAAEAGEVDMLYETVGGFVEVMNGLGWTESAVDTAATCVIRCNQQAEIDGDTPYARRDLRRGLALAVNNAICLELGHDGRGQVAANHHVSPLQPAYADIGPAPFDPAAGKAFHDVAAGPAIEHELITLDDEWQRNTGDAVAAQLRDAGIAVRRRVVPGSDFWVKWRHYPLALTQWNHRPLALQVLSLAYRSGAVWNETGFASAAFDSLLDEALAEPDAARRRPMMGRLQRMLRDEGVIIQPFWRKLHNHQNGTLVNAAKHPSHEIHLYKIGFAA